MLGDKEVFDFKSEIYYLILFIKSYYVCFYVLLCKELNFIGFYVFLDCCNFWFNDFCVFNNKGELCSIN